jgi:hypothetical protein
LKAYLVVRESRRGDLGAEIAVALTYAGRWKDAVGGGREVRGRLYIKYRWKWKVSRMGAIGWMGAGVEGCLLI